MSSFPSPQNTSVGVKKDGAEKRGFIKFFILYFRSFGKLLYCGCLTLLLNLLIIPSGLGGVGMARIARISYREKHAFSSDYFDAIRENWKLALISGLINNIIFIFSLFSLYTMVTAEGQNTLMLIISALSLLLITFVKYYTSAIMLTFKVSLGQLYKNAILLSFAGFWRNMLILVAHLVSYAVILLPLLIDIYVGTGIAICLFVLLIPSFNAFSTQAGIFPVMFKYMIEPFMKANAGEGEKTLRELGLINDDTEQIMQDATE